jgi:hypothetical protein
MSPPINIIQFYATAREFMLQNFPKEYRWQETRNFKLVSESDFLREAAWTILCSGFRASVLERIFGNVSLCFCDWESSVEICKHRVECRDTALSVFRHESKINAILRVAECIASTGFEHYMDYVAKNPVIRLQELPFIGPITSFHLAKNLGLQVAKPDRHLQRLADETGFPGVAEMCELLSREFGESVSVVDIVLWRFAAQNRGKALPQQ